MKVYAPHSSPTSPARRVPSSLVLCLVLLPLGGCGSKISEANYYKVALGMSEEAVEDLLGPGREERPAAAAMPALPPGAKLKVWRRDRLKIRVVFVKGEVADRTAEGIPHENRPRFAARGTADF